MGHAVRVRRRLNTCVACGMLNLTAEVHMRFGRISALAFAVATSLAGCMGTGEVEYAGAVHVTSPELIEVSPGVQVIADADEPLFYSDGYYWLYRGGTWLRSDSYRGGFVRVEIRYVPQRIRTIDQPQVYAQYRRRHGHDQQARQGYEARRSYEPRRTTPAPQPQTTRPQAVPATPPRQTWEPGGLRPPDTVPPVTPPVTSPNDVKGTPSLPPGQQQRVQSPGHDRGHTPPAMDRERVQPPWQDPGRVPPGQDRDRVAPGQQARPDDKPMRPEERGPQVRPDDRGSSRSDGHDHGANAGPDEPAPQQPRERASQPQPDERVRSPGSASRSAGNANRSTGNANRNTGNAKANGNSNAKANGNGNGNGNDRARDVDEKHQNARDKKSDK